MLYLLYGFYFRFKTFYFTDMMARLTCNIFIKLRKTAKCNEQLRSSRWNQHKIDF